MPRSASANIESVSYRIESEIFYQQLNIPGLFGMLAENSLFPPKVQNHKIFLNDEVIED